MISDVVIAILIGCGLFVGFAWAIVSFADERKHPTPQPPVQTEYDIRFGTLSARQAAQKLIVAPLLRGAGKADAGAQDKELREAIARIERGIAEDIANTRGAAP